MRTIPFAMSYTTTNIINCLFPLLFNICPKQYKYENVVEQVTKTQIVDHFQGEISMNDKTPLMQKQRYFLHEHLNY